MYRENLETFVRKAKFNSLLSIFKHFWFLYCQFPLWLESPNSTSFGRSRGWLFYHMSHVTGIRKEGPPPSFCQKEWTYMFEMWLMSCGCPESVWRVSGGCLEDVWMVSSYFLPSSASTQLQLNSTIFQLQLRLSQPYSQFLQLPSHPTNHLKK